MADTVTLRYNGPSGTLVVEGYTFPNGAVVNGVPVGVLQRVHEHLPGHRLEIVEDANPAALSPTPPGTESIAGPGAKATPVSKSSSVETPAPSVKE